MIGTYWQIFYDFFTSENFFESFASGLFATFIGGWLLALFLFLLREKAVPLPEINGRWYFRIETINSAYNPYKGMVLTYIVMIGREGNRIYGTTEKIYENSTEKSGPFIGDQRVRGVVNGFIEKRYFGRDKINLHILEKGRKRDSTQFHTLKIRKKHFHKDESNILKFRYYKKYFMIGGFTSTVSDQDGKANWQRNEF